MKLAGIFQDHMVIQKGKPFKIWGIGDTGEHIRVTIQGNTMDTIVSDGVWKIIFFPMQAARNEEIWVESAERYRQSICQFIYG